MEDEQGEEFLVTIDFLHEKPDLAQPYVVLGLEQEHPILQIGQEVYEGTWTEVIGTEMIFDEKGEWYSNVKKRLVMHKIQITRKDAKPDQRTLQQQLIREVPGDVDEAGAGLPSSEKNGDVLIDKTAEAVEDMEGDAAMTDV